VTTLHADPETVIAFARACLSGDDVILLDEDNRPAGHSTIVDAVLDGHTFIGDPRDGLIVLDVDVEESPDTWAPSARELLCSVGCSCVRVSSGTPGSEHWWFVGPVGYGSQMLRDLAVGAGVPAKQIRSRGGGVRPPLSPHRLGYPVGLIEPKEVDAALALLSERPGQRAWNESRWREVAATGSARDRRYKTRSAAILAGAGAHVVAGRTEADFGRWWRGAAALRDKLPARPAQAQKIISETWEKACERVRQSPSGSSNTEAIAALLATASSDMWSGRQETDRLVYTYLATYDAQFGLTEVSKDQRSIAVAIGKRQSTVSAALGRLVSCGLVEVLSAAERGQAASYRLHSKDAVPRSSIHSVALNEEHIDRRTSTLDSLPDLWRGGLPPASFDTWRAMPPDEWITVPDLRSVRPGLLSSGTLRSHLAALHAAGLVDRNSPRGQKWKALPCDAERLNQLAVSLGVAGAGDSQAARVAAEREVFRDWRQVTAA